MIRDSRGRESKTLAFVRIAFGLVTLRFALGGLALKGAGIDLAIPASSLSDYGAAVALILAIWLGREWTEKNAP